MSITAPYEHPDQRVGKTDLRSRVFQQLEQSIVDGVYRPGQSLTEKQLCEELGVSRTPLREALCQLELEGLVEFVPNKGAVVLGIGQQDIDDIYAIKLALDRLSASLATQRATPEELTELEEIINLTEFYVAKGMLDKVVELDFRFHDTVCKAGKNRPLRSMTSNFNRFVKMARHRSLSKPGRTSLMLTEHRAILSAIASGDVQQAERLAQEHINRAHDSIQQSYTDE